MSNRKEGDPLWVDKCPRNNGECNFSGDFERVEDDSCFFACPECGWEITGEEDEE